MPSFPFTVGESGLSSFRVALLWRSDTKSRHKKTSHRVPIEVVRITFERNTMRGKTLARFPLHSVVSLNFSHSYRRLLCSIA